MCENNSMSAKVLKRTSAGIDDTKVVRYVVDTGRAVNKSLKGGDLPASGDAAAKKKSAPKASKPARGTVTVLKMVKPANPYLSSPEETLETAKRAGIFTPSGRLKPAFN